MKVAIKNIDTTATVETMSIIGGITDQYHVYCISESICYTYFSNIEFAYAGAVKHQSLPGYLIPDFSVYTSLMYVVDDGYDFIANDALDISASVTQEMIDRLLGVVVNPAQIRSLWFNTPLANVIDSIVNLTGELREVETGLTAAFSTPFTVSNNHVYLLVNSITGAGDITITGTSLSEVTAIPVIGDTEIISVDSSTNQNYQSDKKWWEITSITIGVGITAINYNVGVVGYMDFANNDFKINGYRLDLYLQSSTADLGIQIIRVKDDGGKKMSLVTLENIGFDSGAATDQIIDNLRTGTYNRSYNPTVSNIGLNNTTLVFKQSDLTEYFLYGDNIFRCRDLHEGVIIRYTGAPSDGTTGVDFASLRLDYNLL